MSFFMNNAANQSVNMQNMAMAEQELEMVSDLFNRYRDLILNCRSLSLRFVFVRQTVASVPCGRTLDTSGDIDSGFME